MSPRNGQNNSRSQSRGRRTRRGPSKPTPNASSADLQDSTETSPAHVDHTSDDNNTVNTHSVSTRSSSCPENKGSSLSNTVAPVPPRGHSDSISPTFYQPYQENSPVDATLGVGDNTGSQQRASDSVSLPDEQTNQGQGGWGEVHDPFKSTPESFSKELQSLTSRTSATETKVDSNISCIATLEKEVQSLKNTVQQQAEIISGVKSAKGDFSKKSAQVIEQMNELLVKQRGQVQEFQSSAQKIKAQATSEAERQVSALARDIAHNSLKEKAFKNRRNLVIVGLKEHPTNTSLAVVKEFFNT